jgi:hypothetical protein
MDEIQARDRTEDWTVIFGTIYDIADYISIHPGGDSIMQAVAHDASKVDLHCHTNVVGFSGISRAFGEYEKGILAHRPQNIKNDAHTEWVMIYNRIYNVTSYIEGITDKTTGKINADSENAYLNEDLTSLIVNKRGEDATRIYEALYNDDVALSCLDDLFYIGIMDQPPDL